VLVFGRGYLGPRLAGLFPAGVVTDADIADPDQVAAALAEHRPDAVINAAGKTGHPNVDWCEDHPLETLRSNVTGAITLAGACQRAGVYLLQLASGCVFYGPSPAPGGWREDDPANPVSFYSRTRYAADLVLAPLPNVGIVRLRMPVDDVPGPRNLITKLAAYPLVLDTANSITVLADFYAVAQALVARRATGIFHATNPGVVRHTAILAAYRAHVDPAHHYTLVDEAELLARGLLRKPRSHCELASPRLAALGIQMRPAAVALEDVMRRYAANVRG
jgi:dTDP-4-dehydrorhamnose reductase